MSSLINLNEITFKEEVINNKGIVIVDFWAEWCGPCKVLAPILEEISEEGYTKLMLMKIQAWQDNLE